LAATGDFAPVHHTRTPHQSTHETKGIPNNNRVATLGELNHKLVLAIDAMANRRRYSDVGLFKCGGIVEVSMATFHKAQPTHRPLFFLHPHLSNLI